MAAIYRIKQGDTDSPVMDGSAASMVVLVSYYNGASVVQPAKEGVLSISPDASGETFVPLTQYGKGEWRYNGPVVRARLDITGVAGVTSAAAFIWRDDESVENFPPGVFSGLRAMTTQSYTEANVKAGVQFSASTYLTALTPGEIIDVVVVTGAKKVIIKSQQLSIKDSGDVLLDWYKSPTYSGGSNITSGVYNQSNVNPQAGTVQLFGPTPTNAAAGDYSPNDATKPTVTNVGTKISPTLAVLGITGQGSSNASKSATEGLEQVLDANSTYLFRRTFIGATASMFGFSTWYEGGTDLPLRQ